MYNKAYMLDKACIFRGWKLSTEKIKFIAKAKSFASAKASPFVPITASWS